MNINTITQLQYAISILGHVFGPQSGSIQFAFEVNGKLKPDDEDWCIANKHLVLYNSYCF